MKVARSISESIPIVSSVGVFVSFFSSFDADPLCDYFFFKVSRLRVKFAIKRHPSSIGLLQAGHDVLSLLHRRRAPPLCNPYIQQR